MDPKESFDLQTDFGADALAGRTVAFLVAQEGAERSETRRPWEAVELLGGRPELISPEPGEAQLFEHLDRGPRMPVQVGLADADPGDYDALVLPGGVAGADALRSEPDAVDLALAFYLQQKPIAAICHAPWLLVEADLVRDRMLTSAPSMRTDVANAGGMWHDRPVVVCQDGPNALVTARGPEDLAAFDAALVQRLSAHA